MFLHIHDTTVRTKKQGNDKVENNNHLWGRSGAQDREKCMVGLGKGYTAKRVHHIIFLIKYLIESHAWGASSVRKVCDS